MTSGTGLANRTRRTEVYRQQRIRFETAHALLHSWELLIVFIYDCESCKKEEDDPQDAIIYFYPTWVNNEQRHALCSQLMGVTQFCASSFSLPNIISLQSGKFALKKLGRYALCVGTDRNIPDLVLETRANILYKLLRLFHYSIENLQDSSVDEDISDKLAELLQVYLPILQYATNTFGNIPVLKIPKSTSTLYLEARQTLQGVVATQLNKTFTKQLVVTDPYRIKLPAETVVTSFHLPFGVQLIKVYVPASEIKRLQTENDELLDALKDVSNWRKELQNSQSQNTNKNSCVKPPESFVSMCGMKRDVSRIFTVLEEEGNENLETRDQTDIPDVVRDAVKARHLARIEAVVNPDWCDSPPKARNPRPYYNTICDPKYPLFKYDGLPASVSLSESRIMKQFEVLKDEKQPVKSLNCSKGPHGIPLTPLLARLSLLAEEGSTIETPLKTPLAFGNKIKEIKTQTGDMNDAKPKKEKFNIPVNSDKDEDDLTTSVLYVFGIGNTSVLLLVEPEVAIQPEVIHTLWERSMTSLKHMDVRLSTCLNANESSGSTDYSYSLVDSNWGPIERGGAYHPHQLELLTVLHHTLSKRPFITDILVRSEDTITYGYQCADTQVFYQENNCSNNIGLPTPSDLMGVIPLKARRILERDHGIILL
ncbi:unnamed protein product [Nezara viridula]|uniref:CCZ1/INTU/HSP4 first Longin domain-containing protein n=1 Tax=Nezara viridula TaxID=85310 RepID=A0A9P0MUI6_NEZVI|nr:unnamed protein product [Nezara viridula]